MTVRLAPAPVLAPVVPESPDPGTRSTPLPAKPPAGRAEIPLAPALPPAPESGYYPARDLDTFPRPVAPLQLDHPAGERGGEVRLEMLIDEMGVVREVIFVRPARPGRAEEGLRAALAATPFMPARKDGRAVKSRVILRVRLDPQDRER